MKLAHRHFVRLAAVLALSAASASAFAQSAEYRRGYEDGFAAGQRAARDDRGDRYERGDRYDRGGRQGWGYLRVERADYGARGASCDARHAVRSEAERNGGTVIAGNHLCGDPMPKVRKNLDVIYRCGDDAPMRASARENESLRLICRR